MEQLDSPRIHTLIEVPGPFADERRDTRRKTLCVEVGLLAEYQFYTGFTRDISSGGLFIATHELLEVGTRFELCFRIPELDHLFKCKCEVRWVRTFDDGFDALPPGMGVRFVEITPSEKAMIDDFIATEETLFYDDSLLS